MSHSVAIITDASQGIRQASAVRLARDFPRWCLLRRRPRPSWPAGAGPISSI